MRVNGIDGCKAGWVIWHLGAHGPECHIVDQLEHAEQWLTGAHSLIDIPIGFSDQQTPDRLCDKAARQFLTIKRSASVFPVPCRDAVYAASYEQACEINAQQLGKRLSKQSWFILPKVKQVDALLNQQPYLMIRESHPEVVFAAINAAPLQHSKKTPQGVQERLALINTLDQSWSNRLITQLETTPKKHASSDDLIDAFVLMLIAQHWHQLRTLPAMPDSDPQGRVREIVYWHNKYQSQ